MRNSSDARGSCVNHVTGGGSRTEQDRHARRQRARVRVIIISYRQTRIGGDDTRTLVENVRVFRTSGV